MAAAALSLLIAAPASAQTDNGGIASVTVSAMRIADGTSPSITGAIGYRFNPTVSLGVELMSVPSLTAETPEIRDQVGVYAFSGIVFPSAAITVGSDGGHATIFTANLRLTIPTQSRKISPYLIGGGGAGTVTDKLQYTILYPAITLTGLDVRPVIFPPPPQRESIARTTTDFAATFGGGVSFLTNDHWSFDVDARYIGIFGERDARIGRYGGGTTYRF